MSAADRREELEAIGWRYLGEADQVDELLYAADAYAEARADEEAGRFRLAAASAEYRPAGSRDEAGRFGKQSRGDGDGGAEK